MKEVKKSIRSKGLLTILFIVLLFFLLRLAILYICAVSGEKRENEMMLLKMTTMTDIMSIGNAKRNAADASISENLAANVALMSNLLREFVTEDGYAGPRVLEDGFVAELRGGRVILPEEYRAFESAISRELIEESLRSGEMMTGHAADVSAAGAGIAKLRTPDTEAALADRLSGRCFLSFGQIAENYIYVDLMSELEYTEYLDRFSYNIYDSLKSADDAFEAVTLLILEKDGDMQVLRQHGTDAAFEDLAAPGLTEESLRGETPTLTIDGREYLCASTELRDRLSDRERLYIVQMLPQVSLRDQNIKRALLLDLVMVILFSVAGIYLTSVQLYCRDHELTEEQAARYAPAKLRKRMLSYGLLCFILVFASAMLIESVGQMYTELRYGRDALSIFSEHMEKVNQDQRREIIEEEESWFVYYGEELASLLSAYPELNTPRKLQESCDILGIDYIMLFDPDGRQTLCSRDYSGFRLDDDKDPELYDFRRLLRGVPSIVHETGVYEMTGLKRQQIGVKMPVPDEPDRHGALIMALPPDRTSRVFTDFGAGSETLSAARGTCAFAADSATGEILYASNAAMVGKTIVEYGLPDTSLRDGYMDFTAIAGNDYLVITHREGDSVYYYAVESGTMFEGLVRFGVLVSVLFVIVLAILQAFLLSGYNEQAIRERAALKAQLEAEQPEEGGAEKEGGIKRSLRQIVLNYLHWEDRVPEEKLTFVLHVGLIVLIVCTLDVLHAKTLPNESYKTMLGFLIHGDWMRGLNLFCICSILLVVSVAYPINLASVLLLNMTGRMLSRQGMTVCRLLCSCVKYITAFAVLYFSLEYLGFSTGTILASLGVVSLALSLGAQDLIKDILAGLALVFDDCFRVGDVVEIGGTRGTVLEVGVRSTKLRISSNGILFVNNHEIKDILNLSKNLIAFEMVIRVSANVPLLALEELLDRELPEIGGRNSMILKGPYILGVTGQSGEFYLDTLLISIKIGAMLEQKNKESVQYYLKRELRLLFEREGITLLM